MTTTRLFTRLATLLLMGFASTAPAHEDLIDRLDDYLAVSAFHGNVRARISGLLDLEGYHVQLPAPGLLFTDDNFLFNQRFTLFLDAQVGSKIYAFAQARVDRGFDPSQEDVEVRLDEFAVRVSPWEDGRFSVQIGKFSTVVGNWVQRHYSWDNAFITAPIPYENLTGIWDSEAPEDAEDLLNWGHVPTEYGSNFGDGYADKYLRVPIIWGPSYASGVSVSGWLGKVEYAAEMKNASLSSRPESWDVTKVGFDHPTFSGRLGLRPNEMWNLGFSASAGPYLLPEAAPSLPPGQSIGDYREIVFGQDVSFEWHHLQVWAELYEARFQVPNVGNANTFAYYVEAKYKFTPQFFGALRWNQQLFGNVRDGEGEYVPWGNDIWRIDTAIGYRFTPHAQLKFQYSLEQQEAALHNAAHTFAGQFTIKF